MSPEIFGVARSKREVKHGVNASNLTGDNPPMDTEERLRLRGRCEIALIYLVDSLTGMTQRDMGCGTCISYFRLPLWIRVGKESLTA